MKAVPLFNRSISINRSSRSMDLELNWSKGKDDTGPTSPLLPPTNVSLLALLLLGKPLNPLQGIAFQSFVFLSLLYHISSS